MTTIILKDRTMYADTRAYSGDKEPIGSKSKIHRFKNNGHEYLLGCSTSLVGVSYEFLLSLMNHKDHPHLFVADEPVPIQALMLRDDGDVFYWSDGRTWTGIVRADTFCIGSGAQYARGAIAAGADPMTAMKIACGLDVWTGEPIETLTLE